MEYVFPSCSRVSRVMAACVSFLSSRINWLFENVCPKFNSHLPTIKSESNIRLNKHTATPKEQCTAVLCVEVFLIYGPQDTEAFLSSPASRGLGKWSSWCAGMKLPLSAWAWINVRTIKPTKFLVRCLSQLAKEQWYFDEALWNNQIIGSSTRKGSARLHCNAKGIYVPRLSYLRSLKRNKHNTSGKELRH